MLLCKISKNNSVFSGGFLFNICTSGSLILIFFLHQQWPALVDEVGCWPNGAAGDRDQICHTTHVILTRRRRAKTRHAWTNEFGTERHSKARTYARYTDMSINNLKSGAVTHSSIPSPNIDRASLIKGLNPAQQKGKFQASYYLHICVLASYSDP